MPTLCYDALNLISWISGVDRGPQATSSVRPRHFWGANHGSL